jgi:hypothetical protein
VLLLPRGDADAVECEAAVSSTASRLLLPQQGYSGQCWSHLLALLLPAALLLLLRLQVHPVECLALLLLLLLNHCAAAARCGHRRCFIVGAAL